MIDTINKKTIQESQSRVIVTNKSSASLNNLLVYETSSEEDSDDDCFDVDDEIDGVSIASRKKVIRVDSSSSSSCGSIELLNGLESSSSFSDEEELRYVYYLSTCMLIKNNIFMIGRRSSEHKLFRDISKNKYLIGIFFVMFCVCYCNSRNVDLILKLPFNKSVFLRCCYYFLNKNIY